MDSCPLTSSMKISLVIPAHNEEKWIGECLTYAINHSHGKFYEIIVIDNASTDDTKKVATSFKEVKVIYEAEKGLTHARQRGFQEAKGDIIAYMDSDNHMPEGWYEKIEAVFESQKEIACISGPYSYYDLNVWKTLFIKIWYIGAVPFYFLIGYMLTGGNFAIKKDILEKMNGFDTSISFYGEDTNIGRRAHMFGKVVFDQILLCLHQQEGFKAKDL